MNFLPDWTHLEVIVASALIAATALTTVSAVVCGAVFALTGGLGHVPKAATVPAPVQPAPARQAQGAGVLAPAA